MLRTVGYMVRPLVVLVRVWLEYSRSRTEKFALGAGAEESAVEVLGLDVSDALAGIEAGIVLWFRVQ